MTFAQTMQHIIDAITQLQDVDRLSDLWIALKANETRVVAARRQIEDALSALLPADAPCDAARRVVKTQNYHITQMRRINRTIDATRLHDIAVEHGLTDFLSTLFRWKPEINMAAWRATDASITQPFTMAITATPGRPSYTITPTQGASDESAAH